MAAVSAQSRSELPRVRGDPKLGSLPIRGDRSPRPKVRGVEGARYGGKDRVSSRVSFRKGGQRGKIPRNSSYTLIHYKQHHHNYNTKEYNEAQTLFPLKMLKA